MMVFLVEMMKIHHYVRMRMTVELDEKTLDEL